MSNPRVAVMFSRDEQVAIERATPEAAQKFVLAKIRAFSEIEAAYNAMLESK